jgi:hypothetical protein
VGGSVADVRQIFSVRFFAAVGAVVALFFVLTTIFATRQVIEGDDGDADAAETVELHRIDLVEQVFSSRNENFRVRNGMARAPTRLIIDGTRQLRIVRDTPGVDLCPQFGEIGACAIVADLLGEGVVWFALVPMGPGRTVELPAIDTLEDGLATLVNGWQLPYAAVLDRRCGVGDDAETFDSYREFRETMGDRFVSVYDLDEQRLTAVICRRRVPYAPRTTTTTTSVAPTTTTP